MRKKLVVCGGGSSSHTLIPFLKDSIFDVYVYTSRPEKWATTIQLEWHDPSGKVLGTYSGDIERPKRVVPGCRLCGVLYASA